MKTKTLLAALVFGLLLGGCTLKTSSSAEQVFRAINDSMLAGKVDTALGYSCEGTEPSKDQVDMMKMALSKIPKEVKDSMSYEVTNVEDKGDYTLVTAKIKIMGQEQEQSSKLYHKPSANSSQFCVNLTEGATDAGNQPKTEEKTTEKGASADTTVKKDDKTEEATESDKTDEKGGKEESTEKTEE